MKLLHQTLLTSALLAMPFAIAQAHTTAAQHEAWVKAQDSVDIQPTISVTETEVPLSSVNGTSGSSMNSSNSNSSTSMPGTMPYSTTPSTSVPPSSSTQPSAPMPTHQNGYAPVTDQSTQ